MIRKILPANDPRLRVPSNPVKSVDKKILSLIKDLKDTLVAQKDPEGVGLAAAQIGKNLQVFVMKQDKGIKAVVNPQIISISKQKALGKRNKGKILEGCLSLPNYYGPLKRPLRIKLRYLSEQGKLITEIFEGFDAQIVQHEIDHLRGTLFVDELLKQKKPLYELVDSEWHKVEI